MLVQAILVGIWAGIAGVDKLVLQTHIHRPIVTGLIVGLILGDVNTGLITGATLELVWIGAVAIGGAQPPNVVIGGVIGTALAIITKSDPQVTVGLAVPFAVAAQALITLLYTAMSPIMHKFDAYAKKADTRGIERMSSFLPIILFICYFFVVFLCIFFGADKASSFISTRMEYSWLERCRWYDASSRFRHVIKNDVGNILRAVLYFWVCYGCLFRVRYISGCRFSCRNCFI